MRYRPIFRQDEIVKLCTGKKVLHLGFIQHTLWRTKIKEGLWLHDKLMAVADKVVGVDYLDQEISDIRKEIGCECYYGDVTRLDELDIAEKFDVIICGELIEHLENPGLLLKGLKRFSHSSTEIVITTPNPWSKERIRLINSGHSEDKWLNDEHVAWYSMQTLKQLLHRCGFVVTRADYYFEERSPMNNRQTVLRRILHRIRLAVKRALTKEQNQDGLFVVALLQNQQNEKG